MESSKGQRDLYKVKEGSLTCHHPAESAKVLGILWNWCEEIYQDARALGNSASIDQRFTM